MKTCKKCGETLPFTDFKPEKRTKDGYAAICLKCKAAGLPSIRIPKLSHLKEKGLEDLIGQLIILLCSQVKKNGSLTDYNVRSLCSLSKELREHKDLSSISAKASRQQEAIRLICENKKITEEELERLVELIKEQDSATD